MTRPPSHPFIAAGLALAVIGSAGAAQAGDRSRHRSVQGPDGRGYEVRRDVSREPGAASGSVTRRYNNGAVAGRSGSITREDGVGTREGAHTGARGRTQSGWSTIYRNDDGFGRARGVTTSGGRSAEGRRDVVVGDDHITVNRSLTTGSGRSVSGSRTRTRGD